MKYHSFLAIMLLALLGFWHPALAQRWQGISGTFHRMEENGGKESTLLLLAVDSQKVLFEFTVKNVGDTQPWPICMNGMLTVSADDTRTAYASGELQLFFQLQGPGKVIVGQKGKLPCPLEGTYEFKSSVEQVNECSAQIFLQNLPSQALGLEKDGFTILFTGQVLATWFYVFRINDKNGNYIDDFYVARDLSCVYRKGQSSPRKIWGSAANMMKTQVSRALNHDIVFTDDGTAPQESFIPFEQPLVYVRAEKENLIAGEATRLQAVCPGNLACTLRGLASNAPDVIAVSDDGILTTGGNAGSAEITGMLVLDDAEQPFQLSLTVMLPHIEVLLQENSIPLDLPFQLEAYAMGTKAPLHYEIDKPELATINPETGEITPKQAGEAIITVTAGALTKKVSLTFGETNDFDTLLTQSNANLQIILITVAGILLLTSGLLLIRLEKHFLLLNDSQNADSDK